MFLNGKSHQIFSQTLLLRWQGRLQLVYLHGIQMRRKSPSEIFALQVLLKLHFFVKLNERFLPKMELNSAKLLRNKLNCSCFWEIFHHLLLAVSYLNSISCITHIHTSNFSKNFLCINIECASSHLIKSLQCTLPKTNIRSCRQETPKG